jgi:beta-fructofuranosidase
MSLPQDHAFLAERLRLAGDPYRPAYHFVAPSEWLNDPNGAIFWRGRHHLFYQYAPGFSRGDDNKHWGHAVSEDLVHWTDLPVAIAPEPGGFDEHGIWSGTACNDGDRAIAIYHAHQSGNAIATSRDDLLVTWRKHPANPVIPRDPARVYDPCIWKEGDTFYSLSGRITGAALGDGGDGAFGGNDTAYLFRSRDLVHWDDLGAFYLGGRFTGLGEDCAVPDFFPIGDRHCLLFASHARGGQYYTGTYANDRFTPEAHARLNFTDHGTDRGPDIVGLIQSGDIVAPISWLDGAGRRLIIAWITEGRLWDVQRASGWAGVMTLPRVVSLAPDGTLLMSPAPELEALRRDALHFSDLAIGRDASLPLPGAAGDSLEISVVFDPGDAAEVGLKVRCSPDGEEETLVVFDRPQGALRLDPARASLSDETCGREAQVAPFALAAGGALSLRIFVDRSIVEVYANGRQCVTKRIYPSRADSLGVQVFASGGPATVVSADVWRMASIWPTA